MTFVRDLPRTKLWGDDERGYSIVLECECGHALDYPGHPDHRTAVACTICGLVWRVAADHPAVES